MSRRPGRRAWELVLAVLALPSVSSAESRRPVLGIVPVGATPAEVVALLATPLEDAFSADIVVLPALELPEGSMDAGREQHRSSRILELLAARREEGQDFLLGVADVDLYSPGLSFVFGEADETARVAVFSIARLRPRGENGAYAAALLRRRALTEAIHEVGHCHGLRHCDDDRCVMWFSNTVAESDRKGVAPCAKHARELRRWRGERPPPASLLSSQEVP